MGAGQDFMDLVGKSATVARETPRRATGPQGAQPVEARSVPEPFALTERDAAAPACEAQSLFRQVVESPGQRGEPQIQTRSADGIIGCGRIPVRNLNRIAATGRPDAWHAGRF